MSETDLVACPLEVGCSFIGDWASWLEHAPVHKMPHPDDGDRWLMFRRTFVGASEVASVIGANPYDSALDCWGRKVLGVEKRKPHLEGRATAMIGHLMEPELLADYAQRHGVTVTRPATMRHPLEPWAGATPDGDSSGGELVQVKMVGARMLRHWIGGPPMYVVVQCQWELYVAERERLVLLACEGGTDLAEYAIERDEEIIEGTAEIVRLFWHGAIVPRTLPTSFARLPSSETLAAIFPRNHRAMELAPAEVIELCRRYEEHREIETGAKRQKEEVGALLKLAIQDRDGFDFSGGKVTWKNARGSVKWEDLALELGERLKMEPFEFQKIVKAYTPKVGERRIHVVVKE